MSPHVSTDDPIWSVPPPKQRVGRRSSRIHSQFWVRVGTFDAMPALRCGDISATGVYITLSLPVGSPGDLVRLMVASEDRVKSVQSLARITRVVRQDDLKRGATVIGAAFEFVASGEVRTQINALVEHITEREMSLAGSLSLDTEVAATLITASGDTLQAAIDRLGPEQLALSTHAMLAVDAQVKVRVADGSGEALEFAGTVVRTTQEFPRGGTERYRCVIRFQSEPSDASPGDAQAKPSAGEGQAPRILRATTPQTLMQKLVLPPNLATEVRFDRDLSGQLEHLQLAAVLGLLELERLTGKLSLAVEGESIALYIKEGRLLDAVASNGSHPRAALAFALACRRGEFSFRCAEVEREDRLMSGTTALLLDIFRENDESAIA